MNGTATRRSLSPTAASWAPPREFFASAERLDFAVRERSHSSRAGFGRQAGYALMDMLMVCVGGLTAFWLRFGFSSPFAVEPVSLPHVWFHTYSRAYSGFLLLYGGLIVLACASHNLYRTHRELSALAESLRVARAVILATAVLVLFVFTSGNKEISRLVVAGAGAINIFILAGWRLAKRRYVMRRAGRGEGLSRVLIVGAGPMGQAFAECIEKNRQLGYSVCGFLDPHPNGDRRVLGSAGELRRVALAQFADAVFITPPADHETVKTVFLEARKLRLDLHLLPELYGGLAWRAPLHNIGGFPLLKLYSEPIPALGLAAKRAMDVMASSIGLALVSPVLLLAALWIRLDSRGPAIYAAQRVGKKGKKFNCYKLRTMVAGAEGQKQKLRSANERQGPFFKMAEDPRVTRCGKWLRKFSVDELPQLVNVLRGEMSLVGPRPHPVDDYALYTIEHLRRLDVKPGITGLWQVTARRDPSFERNMQLDLEYIEKWSLRLDLKILAKTLPEVLRARGR